MPTNVIQTGELLTNKSVQGCSHDTVEYDLNTSKTNAFQSKIMAVYFMFFLAVYFITQLNCNTKKL